MYFFHCVNFWFWTLFLHTRIYYSCCLKWSEMFYCLIFSKTLSRKPTTMNLWLFLHADWKLSPKQIHKKKNSAFISLKPRLYFLTCFVQRQSLNLWSFSVVLIPAHLACGLIVKRRDTERRACHHSEVGKRFHRCIQALAAFPPWLLHHWWDLRFTTLDLEKTFSFYVQHQASINKQMELKLIKQWINGSQHNSWWSLKGQ